MAAWKIKNSENARMNFIEVNDLSIHFADSGVRDRPALVFVNSLGGDFRIWNQVSCQFESRLRVIRYDKRGHGLSDAPEAPYSMQDHIDDLRALLDRLYVDEAIICGISVGGLIAQGYCRQKADRVRGLILCDTGAWIGTSESWNDRIDTVNRGGIAMIADSVLERWFTAEYRAQKPAQIRGWRNMLTRTPVAGYVGTSVAIRDTDFTESSSHIDKPVLVLCGDQDGATPPELGQALANSISGAEFILIRNAGHLPNIERSEAMTACIDSFLVHKDLA